MVEPGNGCDNNTFTQVIYGDGGNAGYDATNPTWRFNEFTSGFSDSNFENGDPEQVGHHDRADRQQRRGVRVLLAADRRPEPVAGHAPDLLGAQHVWRTWAFGAGTPGHVPQDTTPNIAGYEANCPEFVTSGAQPGCGDYRPLGGPLCTSAAIVHEPAG